jgi:hypothetical protein
MNFAPRSVVVETVLKTRAQPSQNGFGMKRLWGSRIAKNDSHVGKEPHSKTHAIVLRRGVQRNTSLSRPFWPIAAGRVRHGE